ncbi:hypothetical protein TWF694_001520 [Orbilia ellipsospora]|uniref:SET domain-containing protein n=1 Tax=Orbilia ellipsospora TaxID=2528407 RepID=A0AAV9XRX5_9PEZI
MPPGSPEQEPQKSKCRTAVLPPYADKGRRATLQRITGEVERVCENSPSLNGQKNPVEAKEAIVAKFKASKDKSLDEKLASDGITRFVLPEPYEPASLATPYEKLRKIHAKDLIVGQHHTGRYLKIRLQDGPQHTESAVESIYVDEEGTWGLIRRYFRDEDSPAENHLPSLSIALVRDPYLWDAGSGAVILRIDHPGDILICQNWDETVTKYIPAIWSVPSSLNHMHTEQLISLADLYVSTGDLHTALLRLKCAEQRSEQENASPTDLVQMHIARVEIYFKLEQYGRAAADLNTVLRIAPDHLEALYMRSVMLYYSSKWSQCEKDLKTILQEDGGNTIVIEMHERFKQRMEEYKHGNYDWDDMRENATQTGYCLDHADYTLPVRLKKTDKGRRLFTARAVKRGDLLMATRALAMVPFQDSTTGFQLAFINGKLESKFGASSFLTQAILERIEAEPPGWYEKTLGSMGDSGSVEATMSSRKNPDGTKVLDMFYIEEVRRKHQLIVSSIPMQQHQAASYAYAHSVDCPTNAIQYNAGIWFLPSFIRHSCLPNAHRSIIGDMYILRAGCDMPEGTKITTNYSTPSNWEFPTTKFTCTCPIHVYDFDKHKTTTTNDKRCKTLWREFSMGCHRLETAKTKPEKWAKIRLIEYVMALLAKLDEVQQHLPPPSKFPQMQLAHRYRYCAAALFGAGQRRHARCAFYKVLDTLGVEYVVLDHLDAVVWLNHGQVSEDLLHAYRDLSTMATTPGIKEAWFNASVDVYEILYGERVSYGEVIKTLEFTEAKDQCSCLEEGDFGPADEDSMMKRFGIDMKLALDDMDNTPDGQAMMQIVQDGYDRAMRYLSRVKYLEKRAGPIRTVRYQNARTKRREQRKEKEMQEEEERKAQAEKEKEKEGIEKEKGKERGREKQKKKQCT